MVNFLVFRADSVGDENLTYRCLLDSTCPPPIIARRTCDRRIVVLPASVFIGRYSMILPFGKLRPIGQRSAFFCCDWGRALSCLDSAVLFVYSMFLYNHVWLFVFKIFRINQLHRAFVMPSLPSLALRRSPSPIFPSAAAFAPLLRRPALPTGRHPGCPPHAGRPAAPGPPHQPSLLSLCQPDLWPRLC
jgi:hypothetical protein